MCSCRRVVMLLSRGGKDASPTVGATAKGHKTQSRTGCHTLQPAVCKDPK
jgi:hypothetical protein